MGLTRTLRATLGPLILAAYRTRVVGIENVPEGGAILAGNHVSYLDPVLLWCCAPRPVHFMGKNELWESRPIGWALTHLLAFPVHRGAPDRTAIVTAGRLLESGSLVGMFPEGTRQRAETEELGEASQGVAFISLRAGVPVVPVGIAGTEEALPRGARLPRFPRVTFRFGEPVRPQEFEGAKRERIDRMTREVMDRIATARSEAREG
jgi:1-acyl-sn-glycerol-3-phosphate acyltransferase